MSDEETRKCEIQRRARELIAARGWIVKDEQVRPPYAEFSIGEFWLQLDMQGHLEIRKNSVPQEGYRGLGLRGLVYDQRGPTDDGLLYYPELGEQCLTLMRQLMVLDDLAAIASISENGVEDDMKEGVRGPAGILGKALLRNEAGNRRQEATTSTGEGQSLVEEEAIMSCKSDSAKGPNSQH